MARIAITNDYKKDRVRVRRSGDSEWTEGYVLLASSNGDSLALSLDGPVRAAGGMIMNVLPLLYDDVRGGYKGVFISDPYEIEVID